MSELLALSALEFREQAKL